MTKPKTTRDYHGPDRPDKALLLPEELPTPSVTIRCHCLECLGWETGEARRCDGQLLGGPCAFHKHRMGGRRGLQPLVAIRRFCLACMGGDVAGVRNCWDTRCALWPFRYGANPRTNRKARARFIAETAARRASTRENGPTEERPEKEDTRRRAAP